MSARGGAKVLINGRDEKKLQKAKEELGNKVEILSFDVGDVHNSKRFIEQAKEILCGDIDILVCNAGVSFHERDITHVTVEGF